MSPPINLKFPLIIILITSALISLINAQDEEEPSWTISQLIPEGYDRQKPPRDENNQPISVSISLKIMQLISVNEAEQSFTIDVLYHQKWPDKRLVFPPKGSFSPNETIPLEMSWKSKIWTPEVFVINSLAPSVIQPTPLYLEIDANYSLITVTSRQIMKLRCAMDLFHFPQDTQLCDVEFALRELIRILFNLLIR